MYEIPGYTISKLIYDGQKVSIFQAKSVSFQNGEQNQSVTVKALKENYNSPKHIAALKHEHAILKKITSPYVIKSLELVQTENSWALIEENFEGQSLSTLIKENMLDLKTILIIGIEICKGIGEIHNELIIHKDIKPQNIIVNLQNRLIKIVDFGLSTLLTRETQSIINPESLEGSVTYISPEQTGRMNRSIDYRTDIYSLGVIFYEMLTGEPPFAAPDLMELVYMHIAKPVIPPHVLNPSIPKALSEIVTKCLEKNPEARYNSCYGIANDLEKCLDQLQKKGRISYFVSGLNDVFDHFNIPQKLYGREREIDSLLRQYNNIVTGPSLVLVSGYSGIGKSSVVMELQKRGYFIVGKFDQYRKNIPLNAFVQAFQNLIHQILSESNKSLENWKTEILKALGKNTQAVIDIIPDLELIVGPQPPTVKADYSEKENQILHALSSFIKVFLNNPDHPLVIFLDDLQWVDFSSLKLLYSVAREEGLKNLMIIGSYRSNEVSPTHPLIETINKLSKEIQIESIEISPLSLESVNQLVADVLHTTLENAFPLTNLVYKKTQGNPFFVNRFLNELYKEGLITFNKQTRMWESDLHTILTLEVTENVADLIEKTLKKLSKDTLEILKIASAMGNVFELYPLSIVVGKPTTEIAKHLWEAIQADCIIPLQKFYSLEMMSVEDFNNPENSFEFKFQHDRIQQGAYNMIPAEEINPLHVKIGNTLIAHLSPKKKEEEFINIVEHLNYGINLFSTEDERIELAKLNFMAGQKANNSFAYPAAEKFFNIAIELLPSDYWNTHYELAFKIYQNLAMAMHSQSRAEEAADKLDLILRYAKSNQEKALIHLLKMEPALTTSSFEGAIKSGKEAVKYCVKGNFDMSRSQIIYEALKIKFKLAFMNYSDLAKIPEATDEETKLLSNIYSRIATMAVYVHTNDFAVIVMRAIDLTFKRGLTPSSAPGFMGFALSMANYPFFQFKKAEELGAVANELALKYLKDKSCFIATILYLSRLARFKESYDDSFKKIEQISQAGLALGHLWFATGPVYFALASITFFKGQSLEDTKKIATDFVVKIFKTLIAPAAMCVLARIRQLARVLLGECEELEDESFYNWGPDPKLLASLAQKEKDGPPFRAQYIISEIIVHYYKGRYEQGYEKYKEVINTYQGSFPADNHWYLAYFYGGVCLAAAMRKNPKIKEMKTLKYIQKYFKKCTEGEYKLNFIHHLHIIEAEIAFLNGKTEEALDLCKKAISEAKQSHQYPMEAIAYELSAYYYLTQNKLIEQKMFLKLSYDAFEKWGAKAKLKQMESEHPDISKMGFSMRSKEELQKDSISFPAISNSLGKSDLAFNTFIRAAQAITEEIQLDKLVTKLMRLVIVEAGAEKAYLILQKKNEWVVEAEIFQEKKNASLVKSAPLKSKRDELSLSVVQYVTRSMKQVLLSDATKEGMFTHDPYISSHKTNSILCMPLIYQGKLTGILYLENSQAKNAFTNERCTLLNLLSSQIAISIENARFYALLEEKVSNRTEELSEKNKELALTLEELNNTKDQLVESEKLAALGQLIAGIAHEVNTPMGAIRASAENAREAVSSILQNFPHFFEKLDMNKLQNLLEIMKFADLQNVSQLSSKEIRQIKRSLKEIYELANVPNSDEAVELLVDMGIFKDIKELLIPLGNEILTTLGFAYNIHSLQKNNQNIFQAIEQASKIIFALKSYVQNEHTDEAYLANITEGMDTILTLYHHKLKDNFIVEKHYENIPEILCRADELNQVWTNLIHNAIQAMGEKGTLLVKMSQKDGFIIVEITDSGSGIPHELQSRVFTPFFTTKPRGEGSGMGLSISKKIIEGHKGTISFASIPGKTTFTVKLPIKQTKE